MCSSAGWLEPKLGEVIVMAVFVMMVVVMREDARDE